MKVFIQVYEGLLSFSTKDILSDLNPSFNLFLSCYSHNKQFSYTLSAQVFKLLDSNYLYWIPLPPPIQYTHPMNLIFRSFLLLPSQTLKPTALTNSPISSLLLFYFSCWSFFALETCKAPKPPVLLCLYLICNYFNNIIIYSLDLPVFLPC